MEFEKILEAVSLSKKHKVDKDGKVKGVHLLGLKSQNKYEYAFEAIKEVHTEYVGLDIYLNHDLEKPAERDIKDKVGFIEATSVREGVGMEGDIQLNTEHPYFGAVKWWIEHNPKKMGFSHVAEAMMDKSTRTMIKIRKPKSVDLVANAATTSGIFAESLVEVSEGVIEDKISEKRISLIWDAINSLYYGLAYPMGKNLTDEQKAVSLTTVLQDAIAELNKFKTVKESIMDLSKVTLEEIKAARPDLVEVIASEAIKAEQAIDTKVSEAVKDIPEKGKSKVFMTLVRESVKAGKDVSELVADRKEAFATVVETVTAPAKKQSEDAPAPKKLTDDEVLGLIKKK